MLPDLTSIMKTDPIRSAAAWKAADFDADDSWIHVLTEGEIAALDAALEAASADGVALRDMTAEDFPLGPLAERLARCATDLEDGRGFCVLRGLPWRATARRTSTACITGSACTWGSPSGRTRAAT